MKLSNKKKKEFTAKIRRIKELEQQKKLLEDDIDEIKNDIKAYMDKNKTSELTVDIFTVHYLEIVTERFDSKALKKSDEELYNKYLKTGTSKRFSIT